MGNRNKYLCLVMPFMLWLLICGGNNAYAVEDEIALEELTEEVSDELIEEVSEDEVIKSVESPVESNFTSKAYYIEGEDRNNYLVEGGNEDAVNLLATEQTTAGGTLTENSNIEGEVYEMVLPTTEDFENKDPLELRQLITFETKSGKEFHIIIDHGKESDNVRMLTEVSEQDLLNLIEAQADVEIGLIEDALELPLEEPLEEKDVERVINEEQAPTEGEAVDYSLMIILAIAGITGVAGWYFKIHRPKMIAAFDDEVDEADYIDDELINEDYE